ncbi:MAG TPA: RNA polymerase sigma factor [Pilimelia sp.]|nr:RNA polymerase sigma factor [Pilimelia sp.]
MREPLSARSGATQAPQAEPGAAESERAATGESQAEQAIGELYHACYRRLVAQVYAFTTDLTEAQDVVQEAFARALARPRGLSNVDNPEAWLRTVAINVVRRRWRRRKLLDAILLRDRPVTRVVEAPPGPERADLRVALAALPEAYRQVVILHYFADLPVDEVARLTEVPVGTVKSRLSRARTALAEHLGDYRGDGAAGGTRRWPGEPEVAHA